MNNRTSNVISFLIIIAIFFISCASKTDVPDSYEKTAIEIKKALIAIEEIPLETQNKKLSDGSVEGTISFEKRTTYVIDNKDKLNRLIHSLKSQSQSLQDTRWYDDLKFIQAYFTLSLSTLKADDKHTALAIEAIDEYLNIDKEVLIENWTQEEMRKAFWDKIDNFISDTVSQKKNLNQFFYLARASLLKNNINDVESALKDYRNAVKINPKSLWGQQAQMQIKLLSAQVN